MKGETLGTFHRFFWHFDEHFWFMVVLTGLFVFGIIQNYLHPEVFE